MIDPTKVVRCALQDAASIAGLLITTEAMVAERPKEAAPADAAGAVAWAEWAAWAAWTSDAPLLLQSQAEAPAIGAGAFSIAPTRCSTIVKPR